MRPVLRAANQINYGSLTAYYQCWRQRSTHLSAGHWQQPVGLTRTIERSALTDQSAGHCQQPVGLTRTTERSALTDHSAGHCQQPVGLTRTTERSALTDHRAVRSNGPWCWSLWTAYGQPVDSHGPSQPQDGPWLGPCGCVTGSG